MKKKILIGVALLSLSIAPAQAVSLTPDLTFDGSYSEDLQILSYEFENLSANNVSIWMDTLQDGLDARGALFVKNNASGTWDWKSEVLNAEQSDYDSTVKYNTSGKNDFNVDIKNGFVQNSLTESGISDPGKTFSSLDAGQYLFVVTHDTHHSIAGRNSGGTFSDGFYDLRDTPIPTIAALVKTWTTDAFYTGSASPFKVFVAGDVTNVSAVPVPAAVWLFSSALAGLGFSKRRKQHVTI